MNRTIIAALVLALGTAAIAQDKVTLKVKREPGTYVMTMTSDGNMNMTAPQEMKQKINMLIAMEMTADKPTADGQVVHVTYKRFKMDMSSPMMNMSYDSANPESGESPVAAMYKAMLDKTIDVEMAADGTVKDVKGMDKIVDAMAKGNPQMAAMAEQMKKQFGKEMFSQMFEASSKAMPSKPVGAGDTWTVTDKMAIPMMGQVDIKTDYKLKDVKGGIATIDMNGKISSDEGATKPAGAMGVKFDQFKATLTGTMKFDIDKGMATETRMNQKSSINASMGEGESAQKMAMEMDQAILVTIKAGKYTAPATAPASKPE